MKTQWRVLFRVHDAIHPLKRKGSRIDTDFIKGGTAEQARILTERNPKHEVLSVDEVTDDMLERASAIRLPTMIEGYDYG